LVPNAWTNLKNEVFLSEVASSCNSLKNFKIDNSKTFDNNNGARMKAPASNLDRGGETGYTFASQIDMDQQQDLPAINLA
jgi:hypothetical protein